MNYRNLRVVLVETSHPGNIGASARAMKTMGLERLVLVKPVLYPHAEATARASGADDVLAQAQVVDDVDTALLGCSLVIGVSARRRSLAAPALDPREGAVRAAELSVRAPVALMFGRERTGLTNEELERCHYLIHIPANPSYGSLNLAAAVQVIAYELRMLEHRACALETAVEPAAPAEEMTRFYRHLEQVLLETGFLNPANPRQLMRRLRCLFNRAQPDQNEVNILRGILSAVQGRKRPRH